MNHEQLWALRVVIATERRLRSHYDGQQVKSAMRLAQDFALDSIPPKDESTVEIYKNVNSE